MRKKDNRKQRKVGLMETRKQIELARTLIWVLIMVILLGYLMMWLVMPTMTYKMTWQPNISSKLNSTYFEIQGANIMVYTFPVLFVGVAGSIYLHLGNKQDHGESPREDKRNGAAAAAAVAVAVVAARRPAMVRGPLGIVTGVELSFLFMLLALLVWSFSTYLHVGFSHIPQFQLAAYAGHRWKAKMASAGVRLGLVGNICLSLMFFPVTRGSSILPLFGLTSEGSIKYHTWLGHATMTIFTGHGLTFIILWASSNHLSEMIKWDKVGASYVAGEVALVAGLCMWATAMSPIRRKMFEIFFYTHHLYIIFVFFFFLHVGFGYAFIMLPGFYLFLLDRFLRFLQSKQCVRLLSARVLPCESVGLNFAKSPGLSYNPTSTVFINVGEISKLQWHPFTVISSTKLESDKLSVVVKVQGKWTRKLYDLLSSSSIDRLQVSLEGPYGPASTNFLRYDTLVMVSGGSGITPFISIIRELLFLSTTLKHKIPKLVLICAFKNSLDLSLLDLILPMSSAPFDISNLQLRIQAYVTRDNGPKQDNMTPSRTLWLKPNALDAPVSPVLGQNGWVWLGLIISSSFVGFLVFIGIITRYYIYPIDHNTNAIFSWSARTVLYVVAMCVCIVIASSAAMIWNKKRNAMEEKQIMNMEGLTPQATPGSLFCNADREMESLPHQVLHQATEVYYGERPNLKRILFDCEGSSIGVMVCGPHRMRREVATICSSGLANNMQYESISFSW